MQIDPIIQQDCPSRKIVTQAQEVRMFKEELEDNTTVVQVFVNQHPKMFNILDACIRLPCLWRELGERGRDE